MEIFDLAAQFPNGFLKNGQLYYSSLILVIDEEFQWQFIALKKHENQKIKFQRDLLGILDSKADNFQIPYVSLPLL